MVRGKKMGLGEFLGDQGAAYIPEASLPSGPRIRADDDDGRYDSRGPRGYDREPSRSDMSTQWRGDRGGDRFGDRGGDRFGDRGGDRFGDRGGDRFGDRGGDRFGGGDSWRGGGGDRGGPSRFDRPMRDEREPEERPAHMRLNLQRRTVEGGERDNAPRGGLGGGDKWSGAFSRGGDRGGDRFGDRGGDRFGDRGGDRFGDRGDRFGDRGDRFGDRGDRFGGDRFGDRGGDRFGDRGGDRFGRDGGMSNAFGNMRVSEPRGQQSAAPAAAAPTDKKALAQQKREERKKKAEEERLAAEAAKREAAEEKARAAAEAAKKTEADREVMNAALASGKKGEALAEAAKKVFADKGTPGGGAVVAAVTAAAEDVAKASANWIQPAEYGELLKLALAETDKKNQLEALNALQVFLNAHDFPKGVLEKCFMALYSLDIVEDAAFFEYKYDVDSDVPGRMKAIIQTSNWLTWLETPESESEEEDDE